MKSDKELIGELYAQLRQQEDETERLSEALERLQGQDFGIPERTMLRDIAIKFGIDTRESTATRALADLLAVVADAERIVITRPNGRSESLRAKDVPLA